MHVLYYRKKGTGADGPGRGFGGETPKPFYTFYRFIVLPSSLSYPAIPLKASSRCFAASSAACMLSGWLMPT